MNPASTPNTRFRQRNLPPFPLAAKRRSEFLRAETALQINETRKLINSSEGLGWSGMLALQARTQAMQRTVPPASHLFFAVPLQNLNLSIELDGRTHEGELRANHHGIIAPGVKYELDLLEPCDHFYLYIKNDVLTEVADEIYGKRLHDIDMHSPVEANEPGMQHLLNTCMHMLDEPQDSSFRSDYMARAIAAEFFSKYTHLRTRPQLADSKAPLSSMQVQRIRDYMQANLHGHFQVADIAASIGLSRSAFFERFIHTVKKTPNQYLQMLRIDKAKQLLANTELALVDIGFACGYADQSHFSRMFKRLIGVSPRQYRIEAA